MTVFNARIASSPAHSSLQPSLLSAPLDAPAAGSCARTRTPLSVSVGPRASAQSARKTDHDFTSCVQQPSFDCF
eukprot:3668752-Prymnesium_polylepis.1